MSIDFEVSDRIAKITINRPDAEQLRDIPFCWFRDVTGVGISPEGWCQSDLRVAVQREQQQPRHAHSNRGPQSHGRYTG